MKYQSRKFFTFILITFFALGINTTNALDLKKKIPKIGGNSSKGAGDLKDSKLRFTKIFYESSINILEAH